MKPHEAADLLKELRDVVMADQSIRKPLVTWFSVAADRRLRDPNTQMDRLLGLRSRNAGRLTLHCQLPRRDQALRALASSLGIASHEGQADEIIRRACAGDLGHITKFGRIPGKRRLLQILATER